MNKRSRICVSNGNRCNSSSNSSANMISADCDEGGYRNTKSI
ncbi:hypothetical protein BSPWISOXPB_6349 [uncultured Gammaproteobacteria bacterium]|nr:hypothetical protein BSPWISOXPB_6349 [uncultured Gammaproteobacteria bacterium]